MGVKKTSVNPGTSLSLLQPSKHPLRQALFVLSVPAVDAYANNRARGMASQCLALACQLRLRINVQWSRLVSLSVIHLVWPSNTESVETYSKRAFNVAAVSAKTADA